MQEQPFSHWGRRKLRNVLETVRIPYDLHEVHNVRYLRQVALQHFSDPHEMNQQLEIFVENIRAGHKQYSNNAKELLSGLHKVKGEYSDVLINVEFEPYIERIKSCNSCLSDQNKQLIWCFNELQHCNSSVMVIGDIGVGKLS